ncbi:hypothetical protein ABZS66_27140 [Dactylosporangium sp. NPDC005572]|uniref:hypothetical protein n=1 Tax=Dactylosporangium sp. NPDC005572 TaxID=3156889 RepID=UPI0033B776D2
MHVAASGARPFETNLAPSGHVAGPESAWLTRAPAELRPPTPELRSGLPVRLEAHLSPHGRWAVEDLRIQIVVRATALNINHAYQAWQMRRTRPISATALALLFAVPTRLGEDGREPTRYELRADTRTWPASRKTADSAGILRALTDQVYNGWRQRDFDVRAALLNRRDEGWTERDWRQRPMLAGVALSSLDTPYGMWKQVLREAESSHDVPGEALVQLVDGGRIRILRHASREYDRIEREASVSLNLGSAGPVHAYRFRRELNELPPNHPRAYAWHFLAELTRMIYWGWAP